MAPQGPFLSIIRPRRRCPTSPRVEREQGRVSFADGETVQSIEFRVYTRLYYEDDDADTLFLVHLFNPQGGAEIGVQDYTKVYD